MFQFCPICVASSGSGQEQQPNENGIMKTKGGMIVEGEDC